MTENNQLKRRSFLANSAGLSIGATTAPNLLAQRNTNDKIGVGIIGAGKRAKLLMPAIQDDPDVEIRCICDLYDLHLQEAVDLCKNKSVATTKDYLAVINRNDIDAVFIFTPDFWHAPITIAATEARKDIYVEKGLCMNMGETKAIAHAVKSNDVVFQLGHQGRNDEVNRQARKIFGSGDLGSVTYIRSFRSSSGAQPPYVGYYRRELAANAGPGNIDWNRYMANAPRKYAFDRKRFGHWRLFWDYGLGVAGDFQSHSLDAIDMITGIGIPESCAVQGGVHYWKDYMEAPDTWVASFNYPDKNISVSWSFLFQTNRPGWGTHYFGTDATMEVGKSMQVYAEPHSDKWREWTRDRTPDQRDAPVISFDGTTTQNSTAEHVKNFYNCMRTRAMPQCNIDVAFTEMAINMMSVIAYREQRMTRWDPVKQDVV
jgi:predicted dehydrogenase